MSVEPREFFHGGRALEVRATPTSEGWSVRVYDGQRPVTGVVYTVTYDTQIAAASQGTSEDLVDALMRVAQEDIEFDRVRLVDQDIPSAGD